MSSPTGIQSGAQLLAPAPAPAAPMATTSSGTPLTLSTSSTTMTNSSHDPSLRRQPTPAPARAPVETRKISKTTDTNNPQWKMLNQYRVIRLLGRGTHGTVKYGEDMSKDDPKAPDYAVAIKIIKRQPNRKRLPRADGRERTNTALSRIRYEVAVMKRCNHDHIVRLIEVIDDPRSQAVFLVMEYLEGGEIKWRGPEKPLLSLGQTRRIVRDVLLGLEYLHYMGIIHRDIKPANMLWTKGRARVKLTDFGVAHFSRPLRADKSATGDNDGPYIDNDDHLYKTEGTPAFYAPEQAYNQNGLPVPKFERGKRPPGVKGDQIFPMTKALDVWAFGVSIYCFLFGRPPYWGPNVHALCHAIIEDEYVVEPFATADRLPVDGNDPDLNEALNLMKGMMTKPVHARLTLTKAKVSPWLTGDLEHPDAWLKETDPEAKDAIFISGDEPSQALTSKTNTTRISGIMRALGIRKQNSAHPKSDIRSMRGPSQISLEQSTHRHLPKPRSLYRPSADQPASPVDPASTASSPTGTSHYGESYFGRVVPPSNGKIGGLSRMVSSFFRKAKKSTSAEAIMSAPAPITPITPRMAHDISASSSPPAGMSFTPRPAEPIEQELDPLLITYSSEEDDDEDEGDVGLLGYGGFESYQPTSSGVSPSDVSRSYNVIRPFDSGARRFSTANSEPIDTPKRVYDSSYPQHTHKAREDSWIATITSTPSSPKQETVYIPSAVRHPPPPVRSRPQSDDESDDDDEVLEIRRGPRTTHTES